MKIRSIIGKCIEHEMACSGVKTQKELARLSGVHKNVINNIITGRAAHPDVWTIARLADALKVPVDRLLSRSSEYIPCLTSQEQRIIDTYRQGRRRWRKVMDLVVEWNAEEPGADGQSRES